MNNKVTSVIALCVFAIVAFIAVRIVFPENNARPAVVETAFADDFFGIGLEDNSCGDTVVDGDGNSYGSVLIGSQCWMTENMRFGIQVPGSQNQGHASITGAYKYCYGDDPANCETFGALYQWHTAMRLPQFCDTGNIACTVNPVHQGICPKGWHVPTDAEWHELELAYADPSTCDVSHNNGNCDPAASALKSTDLWNGQAGDNSSGFAGLPSGYRDATPSEGQHFFCSGDDECDSGHFWTASSSPATTTATSAIQHNLYLEDQEVHRGHYNKQYGFGLRCLKNK